MSSKQAMTIASTSGCCATSSSKPGTHVATSRKAWILAGPFYELVAMISVSARAAARAAIPIFCVIDSVVFGFTTSIFMF